MKIIILGGLGNLGSQLAQTLERDHEMFVFDRADFDVLDKNVLLETIKNIKPEILINCVAYNAVDNCEDKKLYETALALNCDLPAHLAQLALQFNFLLIHYSTDYVFSGLETKKEFSETDTPNPINKYGESKFLGEQEILKQAESGLKYYLIRTSKLFGPQGQSPQAKPSFFDIMLSLSQDKKELTVVNEELSCFTYTPDLAAATARLISSKAVYGIYHLINEGAVTWYDGVLELFQLLKREVVVRPIRSEDLTRPARRPKFSVLVNNKVKKMRPYSDALREYLRNL
jgi:dTDP-4-dehydrorhamnose reductase